MINVEQIKNAIDYLYKTNAYLDFTEDQIARSLQVYIDRGEFNGSLSSAIECLQMAGYEVNHD